MCVLPSFKSFAHGNGCVANGKHRGVHHPGGKIIGIWWNSWSHNRRLINGVDLSGWSNHPLGSGARKQGHLHRAHRCPRPHPGAARAKCKHLWRSGRRATRPSIVSGHSLRTLKQTKCSSRRWFVLCERGRGTTCSALRIADTDPRVPSLRWNPTAACFAPFWYSFCLVSCYFNRTHLSIVT